MKVYAFGEENAPVILLLPGTCCHWKGNFGHVIPLLSDEYRVLCVSYDGFDETGRNSPRCSKKRRRLRTTSR